MPFGDRAVPGVGWRSGAQPGDRVEKCPRDRLDAEVDRSEKAIVHENDVPAMGVRDDDLAIGVEFGRFKGRRSGW